MTDDGDRRPLRPRRSRLWSLVFRIGYRALRILDPLLRSWIANGLPGLTGVVELSFIGRRTGRTRRTLVTLLGSGAHWYVGHPNGEAEWIQNVEAAGWVAIEPAGRFGPRVGVSRVPPGEERDAVIRATVNQQPFPANVLYRAARRHVAAVGVYLRLEPREAASAEAGDERGAGAAPLIPTGRGRPGGGRG